MSKPDRICVFALEATAELGSAIAAAMGQPLAAHEEREFEDGEHKARPLDPVRRRRRLCDPEPARRSVAERQRQALPAAVLHRRLKDAGAARVTAVVPYLCYARKDRRTKPNDPVTTRYIAGLFEAVGTDAVVTLEVHNPVGLRERLPLPHRDIDARRRCSSTTSRPSPTGSSASFRRTPAARSARSCSARRWKQRAASRSGRPSPKSTAAPAWSRATCSSARSRARRRWSSTI